MQVAPLLRSALAGHRGEVSAALIYQRCTEPLFSESHPELRLGVACFLFHQHSQTACRQGVGHQQKGSDACAGTRWCS